VHLLANYYRLGEKTYIPYQDMNGLLSST